MNLLEKEIGFDLLGSIPYTFKVESFLLDFEGIIEGDQIQVAAFSLEYFSYLTGLTLGQWERKH